MPNVSGFPALETAIGLAFVFFLLSTVASSVNESIANVLGWRAKTLEDAIANLVGDPKFKRSVKEWLGGRSTSDPRPLRRTAGKATLGAEVADEKPTAVDPKHALFDSGDLTTLLLEHSRIRALVRDPDSPARRRARPSYLPPGTFARALGEALARRAPAAPEGDSLWKETDAQILEYMKQGIKELPNAKARHLLQAAVANTDQTLEGFRRHVEHGFDDVMERASGWYKRKVHLVLAVVAAVVALGFNVDTVHVANRLWNSGPVRSAVASTAQRAVSPAAAANKAAKVQELQLPVGWGAGNAPASLGGVISRIPGWLITIAAIALGAPFWFDVMSRIARLRGAGVAEPPRSQSDAPPAP